jgi:hypothetical protein
MGAGSRLLRLAVIATDACAMRLAYAVATFTYLRVLEGQTGGTLWPLYPTLAVAVALVTVLFAWVQGLYRRWALLGTYPLYTRLAGTPPTGVLGVIMLSYFLGGPPASRAWLGLAWAGASSPDRRPGVRRYIRSEHAEDAPFSECLSRGQPARDCCRTTAA